MGGINKSEAALCLMSSKNVPVAMVRYISRNGCNGFRCRKCPLTLVCTHRPADSIPVAVRVLAEAEPVMRSQ